LAVLAWAVNPFVGGSSPPRGAIPHKGFQANLFFTPIKKL